MLADQIDINLKQNISFIEINNENSEKIFDGGFPSVTKGSLNTKKIKEMLNFQPSDLIKSFNEIFSFYDQAYTKFPKQRKSIEHDLKRDILKDKNDIAMFDDFIMKKINGN